MKSINPLTIAHIGCGRISAKHFEALRNISDRFTLAGVCDIDPAKAKSAASGVRWFEDYIAMVEVLKPQVVSISTPNGLHPSMIKKLVDLGVKNIICEKPLSIDYESGKDAYDHCERFGVRLFLICQNRFNDPILRLRKAIDGNKFGQIYMISSNVFWQRPQSYYDKDASWHGTLSMDGGAYLTQATHYVDMVAWIADSEPRMVFAKLATLARNIETEDTGAAIIEFKNNILASINMTVLTYPKNLEGSITVIGEKGTVKIGGIALNEIVSWAFEDKDMQDLRMHSNTLGSDSVYGVGHVHNYIDIHNAIISGDSASIEGNTILMTQKILSAIYESNNTKLPVSLS